MSRLNFILFFCFALSACSIAKPYVDRKRSAGEPIETLYSGKSLPANPVICYNSLTTTVAELQEMATKECQKQKTGTTAIYEKQTIGTCTLLSPNHIYFNCL